MSKVSYITLGCPKNQADTEYLVKLMSDRGFPYTEKIDMADALIVNTCCFIDDAKKESIETILDISAHKKKDAKLIVIGCMGQRYKDELRRGLPEADRLFGVEESDKILKYVQSILKPVSRVEQLPPSFLNTFSYIKIADGCNKKCSFCVIPSIRGRFRSIEAGTILQQALENIEKGVKEIVLVAQDVTGYGKDIDTGYDLIRLIRDIASLEGDFWIRLLYLHPAGITEELITAIAAEKKVCNYFDIPVQHCVDRILLKMNRGHTSRNFVNTIQTIKTHIPDAVLRTTLIVGFPGETQEEFNELKKFVQQMEFDRLGVFKYSRQENTPAYNLNRKVSEAKKEKRLDEIMTLQSIISLKKNRELIGNTFRALVDDIEGETGIARLYSHAPEIDGVVLLNNYRGNGAGDFVNVRITEAYDYDLVGEVIHE